MAFKILIIENEPDVADMICAFLTHEGYECEIAGNGAEGIRKFKESDSFALVMVDISMPEMTGYDVAEAIRKFDREVPIVAVTGRDDVLVKPAARRAGMNHVLSKPVDPDAMRNCVKFLFAGGKGQTYFRSGEFKR